MARALEGRFSDHHAAMCRLIAGPGQGAGRAIARVEAAIAEKATVREREIGLLKSVPGFGDATAWACTAEIGPAPCQWSSGHGKPVFYRLEAEGLECVLADARQVKNLPGRPKRDPSDSRWLAACFEHGSVTSCFVATPEFRVIREYARYRRDLTGDRVREKRRVEKLLEAAAIGSLRQTLRNDQG
jgi:transposase